MRIAELDERTLVCRATVRLHIKRPQILALCVIDIERPSIETKRNSVRSSYLIVDQQHPSIGPYIEHVARLLGGLLAPDAERGQ